MHVLQTVKILKLALLNAVSQISREALSGLTMLVVMMIEVSRRRSMMVTVRIFHIDSGGEDAAVVGWVFNLVHRVGCLQSVVIIFESMIISS